MFDIRTGKPNHDPVFLKGEMDLDYCFVRKDFFGALTRAALFEHDGLIIVVMGLLT